MKKIIHQSLPFIGYLIYSLVFTYPLILNMNSSIPGDFANDGFLYLWNIFEFWHEIGLQNNPFITKLIFFPIGANLLFNTSAPLVSLLGFLFLSNLVIYMNLIIIISLTLSALGVYWLTSYFSKNRLLPFLGGLIYGFSPIMAANLQAQHYYYVIAAVFLPYGLISLYKFINLFKLRYFLLIILFFWLSFFTDYYTAIIYASFISISTVGVLLFQRKTLIKGLELSKNYWRYLLAIFFAFIIPIALFAIVFYQNLETVQVSGSYASHCNTNLLGFITPHDNNPILQYLSKEIYLLSGTSIHTDTASYYLGSFFILCLILALLKHKSNTFFLATVFAGTVILVLSLGTDIKFGQMSLLQNEQTLFYWFQKLPVFGLIDCPVRFPFVFQIPLAFAVVLLSSVFSRRMTILFAAAISIVFLVEYGFTNLPLVQVQIPEVYQVIRDTPDNYTVLELPSGLTESKGGFGYDWSILGLHSQEMYWQTIYQKPKFGGYISRVQRSTYSFFMSEPIISDLFTLSSHNGVWRGRLFSLEEKHKFIQTFNLGYIVIAPVPRQKEYVLAVEQVLTGIQHKKLELNGYYLYRIIK